MNREAASQSATIRSGSAIDEVEHPGGIATAKPRISQHFTQWGV
jgi:hypothetical protein